MPVDALRRFEAVELRRELPELSRLRVHVPEKHDLALGKIVRGRKVI